MYPTRQPVQRVSDTVAHELEQRILEGVFKPGDRLPAERELSEALGVSRPSLREAIQKLASRGLLHSRQGGGTFVADTLGATIANPWLQMLNDHPDLQLDLLEMRTVIETQAAEWAAMRATAADIQRLQSALAAINAAGESADAVAATEADLAFHQALSDAAHNMFLSHLTGVLLGLLQKDILFNLGELMSVPVATKMLLDQRTAIVQAVMNQSPEAARQAAATHAGFFRETLSQAQRAQARRETAERRLAAS